MNGERVKAVALQISLVGPRIALKSSGELMGVIHSMCKKFGEVWSTGTQDMGFERIPYSKDIGRCLSRKNLGVPPWPRPPWERNLRVRISKFSLI